MTSSHALLSSLFEVQGDIAFKPQCFELRVIVDHR
jgi:hypothetical protein